MYRELVEQFNINAGDKIWLSSDITKVAYILKRQGEKFNSQKMLDTFKEVIGVTGTLLVPTFCFDFSNKGRFDYLKSKGMSGVLGNIALEGDDFKRTGHPMHSFAVWGKDKSLLCGMDNRHAFGEDSPFGYCHKNNVKQVMLGTDYVHSMTFVHYVENMCHVPYRYNKNFTGIYVTEEGIEEKRTYDYAARRLDVGTSEKFNRIGKILEQRGIAEEIVYGDVIVSHKVNLGESYGIIKDDIVNNKCRNIYDFAISREELFEGYGERI